MEQSNHKSSQPQLPYVFLASVVHGNASTSVPAGSNHDPYNHKHCSPQLKEVSMQQPIIFEAAQCEQFSHSLSCTFVHPMPPTINILPARTHSEYLRATGGQQERSSHLPVSCSTMQAVPQQEPHPNIFHNELMRLYGLKNLLVQKHEEKKLELTLACEKEMDELRRKYDALIQETDRNLVKRRKDIDIMYIKVSKQQELAEGFREVFNETIEGAKNAYQDAYSSTGRQIFRVPQPHFAQRPVIASSSGRCPAPANSMDLRHPSSTVAAVPPVQAMHSTTSDFSSNPVGFHPMSMVHFLEELQVRSAPCPPALPYLCNSGPSMSMTILQTPSGSRLNQQRVFNNRGISPSISEQVSPMSGSHQPEGSGFLHLGHGTSPSTMDFPLYLAGDKRPNPEN